MLPMEEIVNGLRIRALLSKNLKRLRSQMKISQLSLAMRTGLTHNFINDIENGKKWVSPDTIAKLAKALNAEPYQLFIPEPAISSKDAELMADYLDECGDSFHKMIEDIKSRYTGAEF
jgi:transcriptional regulator with XRE-family HTH domain